MDGKISVDNLIDFLVRAYREMLEDDGELCVSELVEGWAFVENANYDHDNDCVNFQVFEDNYLPDDFRKLANFTNK